MCRSPFPVWQKKTKTCLILVVGEAAVFNLRQGNIVTRDMSGTPGEGWQGLELKPTLKTICSVTKSDKRQRGDPALKNKLQGKGVHHSSKLVADSLCGYPSSLGHPPQNEELGVPPVWHTHGVAHAS